MIVVYTTSHSKNARQWALTNCIQDEDNITLFHVTKTSIGQGNTHNLLYIFANFIVNLLSCIGMNRIVRW